MCQSCEQLLLRVKQRQIRRVSDADGEDISIHSFISLRGRWVCRTISVVTERNGEDIVLAYRGYGFRHSRSQIDEELVSFSLSFSIHPSHSRNRSISASFSRDGMHRLTACICQSCTGPPFLFTSFSMSNKQVNGNILNNSFSLELGLWFGFLAEAAAASLHCSVQIALYCCYQYRTKQKMSLRFGEPVDYVYHDSPVQPQHLYVHKQMFV